MPLKMSIFFLGTFPLGKIVSMASQNNICSSQAIVIFNYRRAPWLPPVPQLSEIVRHSAIIGNSCWSELAKYGIVAIVDISIVRYCVKVGI